MTRHALVASVLVLILGACKSSGEPAAAVPAPADESPAAPAETSPGQAKSATEAPSAEAPAEVEAPPPEPSAADAGAATATDDTASDGEALQPSALVGQFGFDWLQPDPEAAKCVKLDDRLAKKLAKKKATCRRRPASEGFDGQAGGDWTSCRAGKVEWLVYATKEICQEQLETMKANAP
jgi:hypothetical protein